MNLYQEVALSFTKVGDPWSKVYFSYQWIDELYTVDLFKLLCGLRLI